mgnify:FL=1
MRNIEKYKDIVLENLNNCHLETSLRGLYGEKVVYCPHTNCGECKERFLKWLLSEYKEQILDDVEKKYLSEVIRPFKKEVATISKFHTWDNAQQYICIELKDKRGSNLPCFPKDTMYKGMEDGKYYSLKELGL